MSRLVSFAVLAFSLPLMCATAAFGTTYYISASGSDSNSGTSQSAAWLHAPGMSTCSGICSSTTINPGDSIIFRGGDAWHTRNSSATPYTGGNWNFKAAGSSGRPITLGVNQNWYSGAAWARPIITGDNPLFSGSFPSSCTYDFGSNGGPVSLAAWVVFDNFDIQGVCSSSTAAANPVMVFAGNNDVISNMYCHGWTLTPSSNDTVACASGGSNVTFDFDVFDGSDSPHWAAGDPNCQFNGSGIGEPCATGQGIYDRAYIIEHCIFRYMANEAVTIDTVSAHDNLFEFLEWAPRTAMVNAQHPDTLMVYSGTLQSFYNNVARHNYMTEMFYANVASGASLYIFNNIFYDNERYDNSGDTAPPNCINLAADSAGGNETLYVYNNTFDQDTDDPTGGGCAIGIYGTSGGNSGGNTWSGNVYAANNHLIGSSSLSSLFVSRSSGASWTLVDNGGNLIQTTSTARSQGYSQSTTPVGDITTSASGKTVGMGVNFTSSCSTFSSDSALCSGTSGGASVQSGGGGEIASYPALALNARPTSGAWDAGAYQLSVGPRPNPPANPVLTVR